MLAVDVLLTLFFGTNSLIIIILTALFYLGLFRMFPKSGVQSWRALVPGLREFESPAAPVANRTRRSSPPST